MIATRRNPAPALARWIDGIGDLRAIELLRIAAGPITIIHLQPFLARAIDGFTYADFFHQPYVSWYPELPRSAYLVLLWSAVVAAVALSIGAATRVAAWYVAGFVGWNLFLSQTHYWHNRGFLLVMLLGIALLPVGRVWSIDALIHRMRGTAPAATGPLWPIALMRFEVVVVFLASGWSKLVDPDWWGGTVTRLRVVQWRDVAADRGVPEWVLDILETEAFHVVFGKIAVLTEIGIGLGLTFRKTRIAALWVAVWFHISIEIVASVQVFSYAALAALVVWVTPRGRDRVVELRGEGRAASSLAWALRRLDWTGRFRIVRPDDRVPASPCLIGGRRDARVQRPLGWC